MASVSPPTPAAAALLSLPAELIAHIASFVPKEDLFALRLTNRQCQQTTHFAFVSAFFSTVSTDLCKRSLERLARIAQDPGLRPHVRTVLFAGCAHLRCPGPTSPGSGYHWRRTPSRRSSTSNPNPNPDPHSPPPPPRPLDPNPEANPAIGLLQTALAALPNLHTLTIDADVGVSTELPIPITAGLYVLDVMHVALLCTGGASNHTGTSISTTTATPEEQGIATRLRRFLIKRNHLSRPWAQSLVPRAALAPGWGAGLAELALVVQPMATAEQEAEYWGVLAGMVGQARGLRKLVLDCARWGFCEVLAGVLLLEERGQEGREGGEAEGGEGGEWGEGAVSALPLEVLEMRYMRTVRRVDVLARLVLGFRRSLRHVCLVGAAAGVAREWNGMLAAWAAGLDCLRSFQLRDLAVTTSPGGVVMRSPGAGMLVFDGIMEWAGDDGVPDEGTVEFTANTVNRGKERVTGFGFACAEGREGERDAQRVLGKLAEVARLEVKQRTNGGQEEVIEWTQIGKRFLIGGKLEANYSAATESPEVDIPWSSR